MESATLKVTYSNLESCKMSREKLLVDTGMRSLRSLFVIRDVKLLHKFCTSLKPEPIIERLLSQCYTQSRKHNKLFL